MTVDPTRRGRRAGTPVRLVAGAAGVALIALASAAHAQSAGAAGGAMAPGQDAPAASTKITPPAPGDDAKGSPLAGYGMALVLTLMVVGASIMPSKRSHTDL